MPPTTFAGLVAVVTGLIGLIIPLIVAVIFIYIIWVMIDAWIISANDPSKRERGKMTAIIGVVAVVILMTVWGIVAVLQASLF